jgi:hypothetical protein
MESVTLQQLYPPKSDTMDTRPARNASLSSAPPGTESILEAEIKARIEQIEFWRDEESAAMSERLHSLVMEYKRRDQALVDRHTGCLEDLFRRLPTARTLPWAARCREAVERETFVQGGVAIEFYRSPCIGQPPRRTDTRVERETVTTWKLPSTTATAGLLSAVATTRAAGESAVIAAEGSTALRLKHRFLRHSRRAKGPLRYHLPYQALSVLLRD